MSFQWLAVTDRPAGLRRVTGLLVGNENGTEGVAHRPGLDMPVVPLYWGELGCGDIEDCEECGHGEDGGCAMIRRHIRRSMPTGKAIFSTSTTDAVARGFRSYCHRLEQTPTQVLRTFIVDSAAEVSRG